MAAPRLGFKEQRNELARQLGGYPPVRSAAPDGPKRTRLTTVSTLTFCDTFNDWVKSRARTRGWTNYQTWDLVQDVALADKHDPGLLAISHLLALRGPYSLQTVLEGSRTQTLGDRLPRLQDNPAAVDAIFRASPQMRLQFALPLIVSATGRSVKAESIKDRPRGETSTPDRTLAHLANILMAAIEKRLNDFDEHGWPRGEESVEEQESLFWRNLPPARTAPNVDLTRYSPANVERLFQIGRLVTRLTSSTLVRRRVNLLSSHLDRDDPVETPVAGALDIDRMSDTSFLDIFRSFVRIKFLLDELTDTYDGKTVRALARNSIAEFQSSWPLISRAESNELRSALFSPERQLNLEDDVPLIENLGYANAFETLRSVGDLDRYPSQIVIINLGDSDKRAAPLKSLLQLCSDIRSLFAPHIRSQDHLAHNTDTHLSLLLDGHVRASRDGARVLRLAVRRALENRAELWEQQAPVWTERIYADFPYPAVLKPRSFAEVLDAAPRVYGEMSDAAAPQ